MKGKGINNKGASLLLVLAVISITAVLGSAAINKGVFNRRLQREEIRTEENFYLLETAVDEVYSVLEQAAGNALGSAYEQVLCGLYTVYTTNDEANEAFVQGCIHQLGKQLDTDLWRGDTEGLEEMMESCAVTIPKENFTVDLEKIKILPERKLIFQDVCFTYQDPETERKIFITVSFTLDIPVISFMDDESLDEGRLEAEEKWEHEDLWSVTRWKRGGRDK